MHDEYKSLQCPKPAPASRNENMKMHRNIGGIPKINGPAAGKNHGTMKYMVSGLSIKA